MIVGALFIIVDYINDCDATAAVIVLIFLLVFDVENFDFQ